MWERESLIAPGRDKFGYRVYHDADVQAAIVVQTLRGAGLGIPRVREVMAGAKRGSGVQDLMRALNQRENELRVQKRRAARGVSSVHRYLEMSQPSPAGSGCGCD
ncbi:MerR family transcriptional regulator [Kytococcus sedentarius]|uniref:Predicted transcriptional regulator n=1 Tax=Kytococcus sedentarius (strain ATCC 14392 / DSM 20547 / JCM 11482 / CCUG 33030 / NBRC 15357 / NCTC 11040 / CCM 314 / 541) TaxID=478801 RepID=C7NIZ6_KYTSD|nr:predicted transcriptional regulator [Kytococcus sedentarius DSM 20547]QQB63683.1 MerR family transcriptional regulator [Kytococcus sedentarius]